MNEKVTYKIVGFLRGRPGERCPLLIQECLDGNPVNYYTGYDRNNDLHLYPRGQIIPSVVPLKKKIIGICDTVRGY